MDHREGDNDDFKGWKSNDKFALHLLPQQEGNTNGWLIEDDDELERNEADADEEEEEEPMEEEEVMEDSKKEEIEKGVRNRVKLQMDPSCRSGPSNEENPNIATIIAQQLQNILPQIVTQVTNNVNNANGGNGGNNSCSYKGFVACNPKEYDGKGGAIALTRWIKKMENIIDNSGCSEN
nr:reverse transcriptase domain-containing protein [Tanacetum cinerariifolium]